MTNDPARREAAARDRLHVLISTLRIDLPRAEVYQFFARAENLGRITPPELGFRILTPLPIAMAVGTRIDYRIGLFGVPMRWETLITRWNPPVEFQDLQQKGPYAHWLHTHTFRDVPGGTEVEDRVEYRLPGGRPGELALPLVQWQLRRIFDFRGAAVRRLLAPGQPVPATEAGRGRPAPLRSDRGPY